MVFGRGRASAAAGVSLTPADITNSTLAFNPQGGIDDLTAQSAITLSLGLRWITLAITPTTDTIGETADQ